MLDLERETFAARSNGWSELYAGKFVLVKGDQLVGAFVTIDEALAAGASRYGLTSFLVRRLGEPPEQVSVPALTLGLLGPDLARGHSASGEEPRPFWVFSLSDSAAAPRSSSQNR